MKTTLALGLLSVSCGLGALRPRYWLVARPPSPLFRPTFDGQMETQRAHFLFGAEQRVSAVAGPFLPTSCLLQQEM